ncbi:MAG: dual specificity protein phosphatase family protein, partial [Proteobacteria bacterium]|nr:dual specificity protein phosphatase family protein [Pseudomonadota bacterium]
AIMADIRMDIGKNHRIAGPFYWTETVYSPLLLKESYNELKGPIRGWGRSHKARFLKAIGMDEEGFLALMDDLHVVERGSQALVFLDKAEETAGDKQRFYDAAMEAIENMATWQGPRRWIGWGSEWSWSRIKDKPTLGDGSTTPEEAWDWVKTRYDRSYKAVANEAMESAWWMTREITKVRDTIRDRLKIVGAEEAHELAENSEYGAIISIEHQERGKGDDLVDGQGPDQIKGRPHLRMQFYDLEEADIEHWEFDDTDDLPQAKHVVEALAFAKKFLKENPDKKLLIHCRSGIARSTAVALAILADTYGLGHEAQAVRDVLFLREGAAPNLLMVKYIDTLLQRNGKLYDAVIHDDDIMKNHAEAARNRTAGLDAWWAENPEKRPRGRRLEAPLGAAHAA